MILFLLRESDIISVPAYKFLKNEIYINIVSKYLDNPTIYNYYYYNKKTKNNIFVPYLPYIMSGVADIANPTKDNKQTIIKNFKKNGILIDMIIRKTDKKYYEIYENINRRIIYDENGNDWNIPAWTCSKCHHKNDMLPTCIRISANETKKVENPHMFAGSQFCPCCGAMMIESEVDKGI